MKLMSLFILLMLAVGCTAPEPGRVRHKMTGELLSKDNPCICGWPGMLFLSMEVYSGDKLVLSTSFDSPDCRGPDYFWEKAGKKPFSADAKLNRVVPNTDDPLSATIKGDVRIQIKHVDAVKTKAVLKDLELVREAPDSHSWYLAEDEVARVKKAAGL